MSVLDLMLAGGASSAGPAESDAERIIRLALERRTQYPLSQPSTPSTSPQEVLQRLSAQNAADPRSLAGGINDLAQPLLKKLGPIGGGISKGVDFLEQIGDAARGAAERGVLGGIAPRFSAGVQVAAERELNAALIRAQTQLAQAQAFGELNAPPSAVSGASTDRGKAYQDFANGIINRQQYDSRIAEIEKEQTRKVNRSAADLRGERDKIIQPITESLDSIRAAQSLLLAENPFADVASLTSFIRSIDNSVVRPSEQAAYNASLGVLNQIESIYQTAKGQGVLTPAARQALQDSLTALESHYRVILAGNDEWFTKEAQESGIDPNRVLRTRNIPEQKKFALSDTEEPEKDPSEISGLQAEIDALQAEIAEMEKKKDGPN